MFFNITIIVSVIMVFSMALLQFSLILGAPFGEFVLGGQHKVLPAKMRFVSGGCCFVFLLVGLSYLQVAGAVSSLFDPVFVKLLLIAFTVFISFAVISNAFITKSKKEKYVMTPCSIIQLICSLFVLIYGYVL